MAYEYLHTSMYGYYYVKCKVLYRIPFDVEKHGLNSGHLGAVIRKQEVQHKGWKLKEREGQQ